MNESFPVWPNGAPLATGSKDVDIPTLTPYLPEPRTATGAAMVVFPGGGYHSLTHHEGHDYSLWLARNGIAAFVLKYRLGSNGYRHPAMLMDAAQSVRTVRGGNARWNVDPGRVGVMGSSAGGHLASTLLTQSSDDCVLPRSEGASPRPDLGILCYPVITMGSLTNLDSRKMLLGENPDGSLLDLLSNETRVTADTPPCFIWHTYEDIVVAVENSLSFAAALRRSGVPFELHVYEKGRHGIGLDDQPPFTDAHRWASDCLSWRRERGFACKETDGR